jgi:hypothetical protein
MTDKMTYRGITQRTAEWIGMAASVAGGYVAVDGPRIVRTPYAEIREMRERWYDDPNPEIGEILERTGRHQLRGGDYVGISDCDSIGDLILCVPATVVLASKGYQLPEDFVASIQPMLSARGYPVAAD